MSDRSSLPSPPLVGLFGFGAFGRLIATHLAPHCPIRVHDPLLSPGPLQPGITATTLEDAARCPIVILAVPVARMQAAARAIGPHLPHRALVADVGSVKILPADILCRELPPHVRIIATHPLFGPQSARNGIAGHRIVLCPLRGTSAAPLSAFLRRTLGLDVILTTPDAHDRDAAMAQGLTHLLARILSEMGPMPERISTSSFDLIRTAAAMVQNDAPEVSHAIAHLNPHAGAVRRRFFTIAGRIAESDDAHDAALFPETAFQ
ncbi:prephenate dehydrogenase/arogenate dehydrogenase family protein [Gluconacetobacter takamatsuzukensis]|uniref:Prephenate dehydrogenase/arogenate dehydrogenase family protein n=1 Tax=Gluconacetobacter takamatsuzukensis TaxID=1286190 RepID=A0A7W4PMF9_9PROT|nr:prephenate dehydrogenase/arogenate dehydrogenase family protein [Gluconacetobacter takamatsuzukensis]MBB2203542.1 prephenate dehydrogenase/arogenate dehydrogenase family protein [Gluconacetobacter takamatsuzukensis]